MSAHATRNHLAGLIRHVGDFRPGARLAHHKGPYSDRHLFEMLSGRMSLTDEEAKPLGFLAERAAQKELARVGQKPVDQWGDWEQLGIDPKDLIELNLMDMLEFETLMKRARHAYDADLAPWIKRFDDQQERRWRRWEKRLLSESLAAMEQRSAS